VTPRLEFTNPLLNLDNVSPAIDTADVRLDGRKLFMIAALKVDAAANPGTPPIQDRVRQIEATLDRLANSPLDPDSLTVTDTIDPQTGQPIISINDQYLMTVTYLDAQLQGQTPERWAAELTRIIRDALLQARQERQPRNLVRQAIVAGIIALSVLLVSWGLGIWQRRLKRQRQTMDLPATPEQQSLPTSSNVAGSGATPSMQEQLDKRRVRKLNDVQRRLLQLAQLVFWSGSIYAILGLFYTTRGLQQLIFSTPLKVLGILLLTYLAIRISDVLIDRFFAAAIVEDFISPARSQRLTLRVSTFSRVLRNIVAAACVAIALLSILSTIGVNLAPVLAGAGILGLAISFASQNLIKDMINGFLILSEDQYAVGDVIQIDKFSGLVEHMNLRITQLRNSEGRLITIPNGSISVVENLSKDWSRVDLAITIAYDANVDRSLELIQQVGAEMSRDLTWQSRIPEPPEVLGVDEFNNAGVTIRIWIKTAPLEQWKVAREFRRRLKFALDANGIAIGVPQQSFWVHNPEGKRDGTIAPEPPGPKWVGDDR
jgi:small conductance mechanosensitive channel